MKTIKNFNIENFDLNIVDAMNLKQGGYSWSLDLVVEVTDKETGVKVYDTVLENRMVPMWDTTDNWCDFINDKIEDGADIDEDLDYYDADEELQKEFDDMIEEQYIEWFLDSIDNDYGYEIEDEDLDEIFDGDDYCFVIIDGENVWFTDPHQWNMIGYNIDTENEVYKCDEYIIEEIGWNKHELRDKNDIKIVKDLFVDVA